MLDESFRQRLRGLAVDTNSASALSAEAQQRVLSVVRTQGPRALQRARRRRLALRVAGPALAAAAAALVLVRGPAEPVENAKAPHQENRLAAATARACEEWRPQVAAGTPLARAVEGLRLDLGRLGVAAAPESADLALVRAEPCETVLDLRSGKVVVRADDLGGGSLTVAAGHTRVSVHGTVFAVERDQARVSVDVFEGTVAVSHEGRSHTVEAGQRLTVTRVGTARGAALPESEAAAMHLIRGPKVIELESLDPGELEPVEPESTTALPGAQRGGQAAAVRAAGAGEPAASVPPSAGDTSDGDLLAKAERLRRAGDYAAARELYNEVGSTAGVTAEAALLALARMELALGRTDAAGQAASMRRNRFGRGSLGPEAQWIEVRIHRQAGRDAEARRSAKDLVERWPSSPQAAAAQRWLDWSH